MGKIIAISLAVMSLSGCVLQKKQISDVQYSQYAQAISRITRCNEQGFISPDISARGMTMLQNELMRFDYNQFILQSKISSVSDAVAKNTTQASCNNVAMLIQQNYQNIQHAQQQALYEQNERMIQQQQQAALEQQRSLNNINKSIQSIGTQPALTPTINTTCNRFGNTVNCTSF